MRMNSSTWRRLMAGMLSLLLIASCIGCRDERNPDSSDTNQKPSHTMPQPTDVTVSGDESATQSTHNPAVDDSSADDPAIDLGEIDWGKLDGDKHEPEDTSSETVVYDPNDMFDGNENTYWSPNTKETVTLEFSLPKAITFSAIDFVEQRSYITDFKLEIKKGNQYVQVCRLDEMGRRTSILDTDFTAKDFRITVTMSNEFGGISEIKFCKKGKLKNGKAFRNIGYFPCSGMEAIRKSSYDKLPEYDDIIMFDFGCWNKNGEFLWESIHQGLNEQYFAKILQEVRNIEGTEDLHIWFCLQNYDVKTTESTDKLFATAEARKKLTDFAVSMCEKYQLYGIDIDYEYPKSKTAWANYNKFLIQCADALHAKGYKFSTAMSGWGVDLSKEAISKMDYIHIMSYDIFDAVGRHSSYQLAKQDITYFKDLGFKPEQLVLGVPFYTRTMDPKHEFGKSYGDLAPRWRGGLKPWVNTVTNKTWVYYFNGPNMIRDKVYYGMNEGISGVFNWAMTSDIANDNRYGIQSLDQTIIDTIKRFSE